MKTYRTNSDAYMTWFIVSILTVTGTELNGTGRNLEFFSVRLVYKHLCKDDYGLNFQRMWKAKAPLKIKIFMWLVAQGAILTKDNLGKRKWKGNMSCFLLRSRNCSTYIL
jgi:hypothetical protein